MMPVSVLHSYRTRLVVAKVIITTLSITALVSLHFLRASEQLQILAERNLREVATLYAGDIGDVLTRLETSARSTATLPAVAVALRAAHDRRPDAAQTRQRAETFFTDLLGIRATFSAVDLLNYSGDWQLVAGVTRGARGVGATDPATGLALAADPGLAALVADPKRVRFSPVTGVGSGPPRVRVLAPVLDDAGALAGALLIDTDAAALLRTGLPPLGTSALDVTVITAAGDYLEVGDGQDAAELTLAGSAGWVQQPGSRIFGKGGDVKGPVQDGGAFYFSVPVLTAGAGQDLGLRVVTSVPRAAVLHPAFDQLADDLRLGLALIAVSAAVAWFLGSRLTNPLIALQKAMVQRRAGFAPITFVSNRRDEVGSLTRSFVRLTNDLAHEALRLRTILASVAEAVILIDAEGLIRDVNPAVSRVFGYEPAELIGQPLVLLMPPDEAESHQSRVARTNVDARPKNMAEGREVLGRHKSGRLVPIEVSVGAATHEGARHYVGIIRDVTVQHAEREKRNALIAALERSNKELDEFAYIASHDLRAPLRVIDNASGWLQEDLAEHLNDDTRESFALLRNRVRRMERLLEDLLQHSRIGRVRLPETVIAGPDLAEEILGLVALPRGFSISFSDSFAAIRLPRLPILTVLVNLVSNAIKHHDRQTGHIEVSVAETAADFIFTVADDGPGIAPQYHAKVFEIFQTLRPRDQVESSGMGLAFVQKYVKVAGGKVELASDGIRGTTFTVTWPKTFPIERAKVA